MFLSSDISLFYIDERVPIPYSLKKKDLMLLVNKGKNQSLGITNCLQKFSFSRMIRDNDKSSDLV